MAKKAPQGFAFRKLADKSEGRRVRVGDRLVNPDTPGEDHEPWPLAGVEAVGELPQAGLLSMRYVNQAVVEGWLTLEGNRIVHRPGGPPEEPYRVTHTFVQGDRIVLALVSGDVAYRVARNPDKYDADGNPVTEYPVPASSEWLAGCDVDWSFHVELES